MTHGQIVLPEIHPEMKQKDLLIQYANLHSLYIFYPVLDIAIQSVEEKFEQLEQHNILFVFVYDIYIINT